MKAMSEEAVPHLLQFAKLIWPVGLHLSPTALMAAAEVVVGEPQHERGAMVLKLFAEGVRESREAPGAHADREVLSLDVAGADTGRH